MKESSTYHKHMIAVEVGLNREEEEEEQQQPYLVIDESVSSPDLANFVSSLPFPPSIPLVPLPKFTSTGFASDQSVHLHVLFKAASVNFSPVYHMKQSWPWSMPRKPNPNRQSTLPPCKTSKNEALATREAEEVSPTWHLAQEKSPFPCFSPYIVGLPGTIAR